jgi:hypothetical protein
MMSAPWLHQRRLIVMELDLTHNQGEIFQVVGQLFDSVHDVSDHVGEDCADYREVIGSTALPLFLLPGGLGDSLSRLADFSVDDLESSTGFLLVDRVVTEDSGLDGLGVS